MCKNYFLFTSNIAQYNRGGKKRPVQRKACQKGKKKSCHLTPPGGRRAKMKKVSKSAMILVEKNNQKRNADMNKNTTKRIRIDYAMRKIIQRRWNKNIEHSVQL